MHQPGTRAGRSRLAIVSILTVTLVVAAGADLARSSGLGYGRQAHAASGCGGQASLAVSDRHPRQLGQVRFNAAVSTVPPASVVFYDFSYGDGSDDASVQPTAVHAFRATGTNTVELTIMTICSTIITSPKYPVVVRDGVPPSVAISSPRANRVVHFGRAGLRLTGTAHDPSGVRRVELAIELLSVKRSPVRANAVTAAAKAPAARAGCYWYDGDITLRVRPCSSPLFFSAHLRSGVWSFRMNSRSRIPAGGYAVRVRATDGAGNTTSVLSPMLRNIVGFSLVP